MQLPYAFFTSFAISFSSLVFRCFIYCDWRQTEVKTSQTGFMSESCISCHSFQTAAEFAFFLTVGTRSLAVSTFSHFFVT